MTGITVTFNGWCVTNPVSPILVNIMTAKAESWLLLEQVIGFTVTVSIMTGSAVLVSIRGILWWQSVLMAGDTQTLCIISQHKR